MEQIKLEIDKLNKALEKLESGFDKIQKTSVVKESSDDKDIKKEVLNLRNKIINLINEFEQTKQ